MVRRSWLTPASMVVRCSTCWLDAVAHLEERLRRLAHLARAARPEVVGDRAALAEGVGGFGEPQDRPDLVAQEQDRDASAARPTSRPSRSGRCASSTRRSGCAWRRSAGSRSSSLTRISTCRDLPTVSIQNGRLICRRISSDSARSSSAKNGLRLRRRQIAGRQHLHRQVEPVARHLDQAGRSRRCAGSPRRRRSAAAMSRAVASDRRRVTACQWRSMNTKATTPSSSTIGAMMMIRARA